MAITHRQAFFNLLNSQHRKSQFSPEKLERIKQLYRDDLKLTEDLDFGAKAFEDQTNKRIKDHTGFKIQIGPEEGDTLEKALKGDSVEKNAVREQLKQTFDLAKFYTPAQEKYQESIEVLRKRINQLPEEQIDVLRAELVAINQTAKNALLAQQKMELQRLKDSFDEAKNPGFMKKFETALGKDTEEAEKVKNDLIAELEKSHAQQVAEFDNGVKENVTLLDKARGLEQRKMLFTGQLESWAGQLSPEKRDKMLQEIELAREENRKRRNLTLPEENTTALVDVKENTISAVNPEDLNFIISLTGSKINHLKGKDKDTPGLWKVEMSPRILSPFYYLSRQENPKVDMLTMAQAVRASGFDSITLTVNFDDPKTQKERARQAYQAALETGFAPGLLPGEEAKGDKGLKGIILKDGAGNEIKPETLFTPGELQKLHDHAKEQREKLGKLLENAPKEKIPEETSKKFRSELTEGRDKIRLEKGKEKVDLVAEQALEEEVQKVLTPH